MVVAMTLFYLKHFDFVIITREGLHRKGIDCLLHLDWGVEDIVFRPHYLSHFVESYVRLSRSNMSTHG